MNVPSDSASPKRAAKNRTWIVFFLLLAFLAGLGIVVPVVYNLSLQLKAAEVVAAKELWLRERPADYDMEYSIKIDRDEPVEFRVMVRGGKVRAVTTLLAPPETVLAKETYSPAGAAIGCTVCRCCTSAEASDELTQQYTIDAFFALIESKLRDDVAVGGRNYATAMFDRRDGHPLRYIHRVRGTSERIELDVQPLRLNDQQKSN
jgi:hypothetical protein